METIAPSVSETSAKLFSRLVLPSAHNVGMIDMQKTDIILQTATERFVEVFKGILPLFNSLSKAWVSVMAPQIVYTLAFRQEDNSKRCLQLEPDIANFVPRTSVRISCHLVAC